MFTENNYLLTPGKRYGEAYEKTKIEDVIKRSLSVATLQLPNGNTSFLTQKLNIDVFEYEEADEREILRLTFENTMGSEYQVELDPTTVEIFCKFSKFKNLSQLLGWEANFASLDWRGLPVKMTNVEPISYTGNLYKFSTTDVHTLLISGIVFKTKYV